MLAGWVAHGECGRIMVDMIKNIVCMCGIVKESFFFLKLKKTLGRHDLLVGACSHTLIQS